MRIVSLLYTCLGFLDFTSAMRGPPIRPTAPARIDRAIPKHFPKNTYVFVQNTDGEVFAAHLTERGDRLLPAWVKARNYIMEGKEDLLVEMPNGGDLLADTSVNDIGFTIDVNDEMPLQPRCFILYRKTLVLLATLVPYERYEEDRPKVPRVIVRMPKTFVRYTGEFQRSYDQAPQWLSIE